MDIAMLGLGRMGGNMARRLLKGGHHVTLWNRTTETAEQILAEGGSGQVAHKIEDVAKMMSAPRVVWFMLPAGKTTEDALNLCLDTLTKGDVIVDGGNANFKDSQRRAAMARERGFE